MARKLNMDLKPWSVNNTVGIDSSATRVIDSYQSTWKENLTVFCDNASTCHTFRKGSSKCLYTWTVLKALDDVASGSMSIVSIIKTRRCSVHGEKVPDTIAKGDIASLATSSDFASSTTSC